MKKYILIILSAVVLATTSCDDILDRPQLNTPTDGTFWKTEMDGQLIMLLCVVTPFRMI